jgi:uncharacterized lipoprotein YddW (UPF0748 family)
LALTFIALIVSSPALAVFAATTLEIADIVPPKPLREFRGAWIATIANLDWPSRKAESSVEQKAELLGLLDRAAQLKLNTVIFQVRPCCDAFYTSRLEPWSEYLTGTMGKEPLPFYDPLTFAIEEAHKRGLELHAWFNPFRVRNSFSRSAPAGNHVTKTHPNWVRHYGNQLWLDPGEPEAQKYSLDVVMDVVRRYDIDGVHFDDYFYPYPAKDRVGNYLEFPDYSSWKKFGAAGRLSRDDWRRENVNGFIRQVYESIKAIKPWIKFGISPFGIWRPAIPAGIDPHALDAYGRLYADSRKWLMNGWLDYFAPQLYWPIQPSQHSFASLLEWWAKQNLKGRHLVPGLDSTKTQNNWSTQEIINQIRVARQENGVSGHIHWNLKTLKVNAALAGGLANSVYLQPALVPPTTWQGPPQAVRPRLIIERLPSREQSVKTPAHPAIMPLRVHWETSATGKPWLWLLQTRTNGQWTTEILAEPERSRVWNQPPEVIALSGVDRNGNTSDPVVMKTR